MEFECLGEAVSMIAFDLISKIFENSVVLIKLCANH